MEKSILFLKEYGVFVAVGLMGAGIIGYGIWGVVVPPDVKVEIVSKENQEVATEIVVDIAGGVENPGVYKVRIGSRIGDALVAAGGLSAQADRVWIAQTMNLAKEIKDGEKVYIPMINNQIPINNNQTISNLQISSINQASNLININTASVAELDKLEGIGEVRAQSIVSNRPYSQIEELISKAKLSEAVYAKIKDLVSVY